MDSCLVELTVTSVPRAKKYGPVVRVNVFHKTSVIVTSPESVKVGGSSGAMASFPWFVGDTGPKGQILLFSLLRILSTDLWQASLCALATTMLSVFPEVGLKCPPDTRSVGLV